MLYLDIVDFLDPQDVDYTDLFLLVCRQLLESLHGNKVSLSENLLHEVEKWFVDVTKETEKSVELSGGVSVEAKAGAEIPFLARLLGVITASIKAGSKRKETTRQELDRYFSGLSSNTNVLLTAASQALGTRTSRINSWSCSTILTGLPPKKSEELFFAHGSQLQEMACHAVYTVSIDTYYSRRHLANVFPNRQIIPNVKLRASKSSSEPNRPGIDALLQVIQKRLSVEVLPQPSALAEEFVRRSGGSIRQLIRLLREAVQSAQARGLATLDSEALEDAARSIQQDYERMLEPSDYKLLARTYATKSIEKDDAHMQLLSNLAILEYNGKELWHDVNPLIEPIDAFQSVVKETAPNAAVDETTEKSYQRLLAFLDLASGSTFAIARCNLPSLRKEILQRFSTDAAAKGVTVKEVDISSNYSGDFVAAVKTQLDGFPPAAGWR